MMRLRCPARLAGEYFGRQFVAEGEARDEIERLGDQAEHPPVCTVILNREFALQGTQGNRSLPLPQWHHHHGGAIGFGPAKRHGAELGEGTVIQATQFQPRRGICFRFKRVQQGRGIVQHRSVHLCSMGRSDQESLNEA